MRFIVIMEPRGIRENSSTRKHGDFVIRLFCRGEDAEDAFAAWDGDSFAFELGDYVGFLGGWGGVVAGW